MACALQAAPAKEACPARPALDLGFAVAHVAGAYPELPEGASQIGEGADAALALGAKTIKIYMTPNVREKYRDAWPKELRSLSQLAETSIMRAIFARPFQTFVITTYSFANGVDGRFIDGFDALEAQAEYRELRAFAELLLRTYRRSGKRFVLQNWEGDFAARGGFEAHRLPSPSAREGMRRYIEARQQAVRDARGAVGEHGVQVDAAFEVNALLGEGHEAHVVHDVAPSLCLDALSYSSWEAFAPLYDEKADGARRSAENLARALAHLRASARGRPNVYLGEIGVAQNELRGDDARLQAREVLRAARLENAIWWQLYDNECDKVSLKCRGFGLYRRDGSSSELLQLLRK